MNADEPVYENSSHIFINVGLHAHVEAAWLCLAFCQLHMLLNLIHVEANMVDVSDRGSIDLVDPRVHIVGNTLLIGLQFVVNADGRELFAGAKIG